MFEEKEQTSLFTVEMDYEEMIDVPEDYLQVRLNELEDKETFTGKPQISGINKREFETDQYDNNGNPIMRTVYQIRLVLVNKEEEQYLDININLKQSDYQIQAIRKGSVLFDMIQSILEIENKGCTKGKNIFRNVNLKQFTDFINNNVNVMAVRNLERHGRYNFNSFQVIRLNNMQLGM